MFSLPVTLIVLLVAFGALVAAGLPLLLALTAVFATMGLLALPSQLMPLDADIGVVVLLIGLAVGVDYSLFYLKREREERAAGRSERAALEAAAATSGRSVLDLRPDRDGRDGRDAVHRRQDLHGLRHRDDDRRRDRRARLADRPAGHARRARRQGRPAAGAVPRTGCDGAMAAGGCGARSSIASCAVRSSRRSLAGGAPARARRARAAPAHRRARASTRCRRTCRPCKTYNKLQKAFPVDANSAQVLVQTDDAHAPGRHEGDRRARAAGDRDRPVLDADQRRLQRATARSRSSRSGCRATGVDAKALTALADAPRRPSFPRPSASSTAPRSASPARPRASTTRTAR